MSEATTSVDCPIQLGKAPAVASTLLALQSLACFAALTVVPEILTRASSSNCGVCHGSSLFQFAVNPALPAASTTVTVGFVFASRKIFRVTLSDCPG